MGNVGYRDDLQRIAPAKCIKCEVEQGHADDCPFNRYAPLRLVIDPPLREDIDGWGHIGNVIISYAIIHVWKLNNFLEPVNGSKNLWVLSERGQLAANGKLKDEEIKMPASTPRPGEFTSDEILESPIPGLLFTRGGTCTLCKKKMDVFGQISHAKSHINKGHPVMIEEVNDKKVARITSGVADFVPPAQPRPVEPGSFTGPELYSTTGICRLCPEGSASVHLFGRISHAKSHIKRGHPVEIRTVNRKNVPMVLGEALPIPTGGALPVNDSSLTPAEHQAREEGIDAILTLNRVAGLEIDREEAGVHWDNMGPVTKMQTLRTAAKLED